MKQHHVSRRFRLAHHGTLFAVSALLAGALPVNARAQTFLTEAFSNVPSTSQRVALTGDIPGTNLTVTTGRVQVVTDPAFGGRGNYLWMPLGFYQQNWDQNGYAPSAIRSQGTFDLFAGVTYRLSFDWSRQDFSSGNGPFPFMFTARLGSSTLVRNDFVGVFFGDGLNWVRETLTFTPQTTELAAIMAFAGNGNGYSGFFLDNITMVGVEDTPPNVVPEPTTWALLLTGLAFLAMINRRKTRAGPV